MFEEFSFETRDCLLKMVDRYGCGTRDVEILLLRARGLTLDKIAKKTGLCRERVRQLIERASIRFRFMSKVPRMDHYEDVIRKRFPHEAYYESWKGGRVHCGACSKIFSVAIPPHFSQFEVRCPDCGEKIILKITENKNVQKA